MIRKRSFGESARSVTAALVTFLGLVVPAPGAAAPPHFAVQLLDPEPYKKMGADHQATAINQVLEDLEKWQRLPGIEFKAGVLPIRDFDYRLSGLKLESFTDSLSLEAYYEGPDGFSATLLGYYRDPCSSAHRRAHVPCDSASLSDRAKGVIADLFHQTLQHWRSGLYRPFTVKHCSRRGDQVLMKVVSTSVVAEYSEPAVWFRYRPGLIDGENLHQEPEPLEIVLLRRTPAEEIGTFLFWCEFGSIDVLDPFCPRDDETAGEGVGAVVEPENGAARIVLEHRYPGRHLGPPVIPLPVAVNAAPGRSGQP